MIKARVRLRGVAISTRAALRSHPDRAPWILADADRILDRLEADVVQSGRDEELLRDIAALRDELARAAGAIGVR